ncbi:MAG: Re/Si-specific NAD(P)(+) transhydrogenase subunit alpha [Polyangia bacterium]
MANIAGYRAVIEAASFFGRFFTGQVTAAGKVPPAKVMVIGAESCRPPSVQRAVLAPIVRAFDTCPGRPRTSPEHGRRSSWRSSWPKMAPAKAATPEVMSPEFIAAEMALFEKQAREVDIIITTALIPGKAAPQLILRSHVEQMRPGSVIVDLAAESGGNCEVTRPGEVINHRRRDRDWICRFVSRPHRRASSLYGNNLVHLLTDMGGAAKWQVNQQDEVVRGALVVCDGEILGPPPKPNAPPPDQQKKPAAAAAKPVAKEAKGGHDDTSISPKAQVTALLAMAAAFLVIGLFAPPAFLAHLTVFVLACFVGWQVVWNVTPALHTPLMSVTNAISGIIILGGMLKVGGPLSAPSTLLAAVAVLLSTINIAGGFLVTSRMLKMFRK